MNDTGLPTWVWELVDALDRSADAHQLLDHVPDEIRTTLAYIRDREKRAMAVAWDQGFTACAHQHLAQREDPEHYIRRDNPYEEIPF